MAQETFADVLRKFPQAVSIVTVGRGGVENALTVSWASPVSFDPPQMMISVDRLHYSADFLRSTRNFCLNVLRDGQQRLAGQFARQTMANEKKMEGVATREAIDSVMKLGMNHPLGPLALADLIGLDVCLNIMNVLHDGFGDSKYRPCPLLRKMVAAGRLGRKSGAGFYEYA